MSTNAFRIYTGSGFWPDNGSNSLMNAPYVWVNLLGVGVTGPFDPTKIPFSYWLSVFVNTGDLKFLYADPYPSCKSFYDLNCFKALSTQTVYPSLRLLADLLGGLKSDPLFVWPKTSGKQ